MTETEVPSNGKQRASPTADASIPEEDQLVELCRLIAGVDRNGLSSALHRFENRQELADHISKILADATRISASRDQSLAKLSRR